MSTAAYSTGARRPGPSLRVSLLLVFAGVALAVPTLIAGVVPIVRAVTSPVRFESPGPVRMHLSKGEHMVYEDVGSNSLGSAFSQNDTVSIGPADVTVTDPFGTNVAIFERSLKETITSQGDRFVGAVRFTASVDGDYTVTVRSSVPKLFLVARPLSDSIKGSLAWFALSGLGGLVLVTGIVMVIVGSVRRGRTHNAFAYATPTPPGWYADPSGSGRLRYWDGYRWTEHVQ